MSPADITTADVTVARGEVARSRTATELRIAELIGRFRAEELHAASWAVRDRSAGEYLPDRYSGESAADAGARIAAAVAIRRLFDAK